jgi:hypothetical protein
MEFSHQRIEAIDFGVPAIKYEGRWWEVSRDLVDKVWPDFQKKISASLSRPDVQANQNNQEPD